MLIRSLFLFSLEQIGSFLSLFLCTPDCSDVCFHFHRLLFISRVYHHMSTFNAVIQLNVLQNVDNQDIQNMYFMLFYVFAKFLKWTYPSLILDGTICLIYWQKLQNHRLHSVQYTYVQADHRHTLIAKANRIVARKLKVTLFKRYRFWGNCIS